MAQSRLTAFFRAAEAVGELIMTMAVGWYRTASNQRFTICPNATKHRSPTVTTWSRGGAGPSDFHGSRFTPSGGLATVRRL